MLGRPVVPDGGGTSRARKSVYATNSSFIEFIRLGEYLFYIGLVGFFVSAAPVYWAKLTRKGMVSGFIYAYIRHPQYLFFMLSAFGLLFIWPRMMMLVLFLGVPPISTGQSGVSEKAWVYAQGEAYVGRVSTH